SSSSPSRSIVLLFFEVVLLVLLLLLELALDEDPAFIITLSRSESFFSPDSAVVLSAFEDVLTDVENVTCFCLRDHVFLVVVAVVFPFVVSSVVGDDWPSTSFLDLDAGLLAGVFFFVGTYSSSSILAFLVVVVFFLEVEAVV